VPNRSEPGQPSGRTRARRSWLTAWRRGIALLQTLPWRRGAALAVAVLLDLTALLVVSGLVPLFYWRILTSSPDDAATFLPGDFTELHYPYRRWVAYQIARGEPAWWDPYVSAGQSAVGDIQYHVFYPPDDWLARWAGAAFPVRAYELGVVAHVALAVVFTYLLGRRLSKSRLGGMVAAVIFGFGGYLSGFPVQQVIILETSIWLPFILLCIDIGADRGLISAFVVGAVGLALAALAGHPQTLFYVAVTAGLYLAFKGIADGALRWVVIAGAPVLFGGGLGLAAIALVPAYFHLALTDRTEVAYAFTRSGFALHELLGLIFPIQYGGAALYSGVASLLLVVVGLMGSERRAQRLFWLALGLLGLLLSLGGATFLQAVLYLALGSLKFRDYERFSLLVSLAVAILAAYGIAEVVSKQDLRLGWFRRGIGVAAVMLIVFLILCALAWGAAGDAARTSVLPLLDRAIFTVLVLGLGAAILLGRERRAVRPRAAGFLLVAVVTFDLFSTNWQVSLQAGAPENLFPTTPIVNYLSSYTTGLFRIASEGLLPGDGNAGALLRVPDVVGNSPLDTRLYAGFTRQVPEWTRWQILNVRYVLTRRQLNDPRLHLLLQDSGTYLYEIDSRQALPRAYLAYHTVPVPDHVTALALLRSLDPREATVVEGTGLALDEHPSTGDRVTIPRYGANAMAIQVTLGETAVLVVSEIDYPGWTARLDGHPVPILRANGVVRAVLVPPGEHTVEFRFEPPGLSEGEEISMRTARILVALVLFEVVLRLVRGASRWWRSAARAGRLLARRAV